MKKLFIILTLTLILSLYGGGNQCSFVSEAASGYTVTTYNTPVVMYVINSVNVRKGPSTAFNIIGSLSKGTAVTVTGQADTNWYEIKYGEGTAYVSNKYLQAGNSTTDPALAAMRQEIIQQLQAQGFSQIQIDTLMAAFDKAQAEAAVAAQAQADAAAAAKAQADSAVSNQPLPGTQPVPEVKNTAGIILVGDSRFVQMQEAVGPNYCTWIAEGGKGYTWFEETAIPRIDNCVGSGSKILINLGVNDTRNLQKYITLVNSKAAEWTALGATVYYASVNPVWENIYVTEEQVEYFNTQMHNNLSPYVHWIDSHSYISSIGCRIVDGLHYNKETYQNLYTYFLACMG